MEKYQKVQKARPETPYNENEMRITSVGLLGNYVNYATALFQERRGREIILKGMGQAISKTVAIAEILKRRMPQLHQDTAIDSVSIVDVWDPIEEGLLPVETSRHVSTISITLSTKELNKDSPGYQGPAYVEQSRPQQNYQQRSRQARISYNVVSEDAYGHDRVRGRGRGRGWNRGGYRNYEGNYRENYQGGYQPNYQSGYQGNYQGGYQRNYQGGYQGNYQGGYQGNYSGGYQGSYQENGGYSNWSRGGARGPRDGGYSYRGTGYGRGRGRGGGREQGLWSQY